MKCAVKNCQSYSMNKNTCGVSFHRFPSNIERREIWTKRLKFAANSMSSDQAVCSLHFRAEDINITMKKNKIKRQLNPGALPIERLTREMMDNWKSWCRLCAKINSNVGNAEYKKESLVDQLEIINKHFSISPQLIEGTLYICNDCSNFLGKLDNFRNQCQNAEKMFEELRSQESENELDLNSIRLKYGFEHEEIKEEELPSKDILFEVFEDIQQDPLETELEIKDSVAVKLETPDVTVEELERIRKKQEDETINHRTEIPDSNIGKNQDDFVLDIPAKNSAEDDNPPSITHERPSKTSSYIKKAKKPKKENICEFCSKKFRAPCYLRDHVWTQHRKEERPFVCSECQKRFTTKRCLTMHMTVHLPDEERLIHPCLYCDKKFSQKVGAEVHMNSVHNRIEKTFVCEECGKSFTTKTGLKQHIDTHIEVRTLKCPFCPKMFNNTHRLSQHKTFHKNTVFNCPHCDAKLGSKVSLKTHLLIHSDIKQYKCNYCGNEFRRPKDLKHHLFLHTGEKPYECPFCDRTFRSGTNSRTHQKKIHPVEFAAREASRVPREVPKLPKLDHSQSKLSLK